MTTLNLIEIITILITHYIADFIFQDEVWALNKSESSFDLIVHTTVYSILWYFPMSILLSSFLLPLLFILIIFTTHTITDYFTSRIVSKKFANNHLGSSIPNFGAFSIIGLDQLLHYIQLFTAYICLK